MSEEQREQQAEPVEAGEEQVDSSEEVGTEPTEGQVDEGQGFRRDIESDNVTTERPDEDVEYNNTDTESSSEEEQEDSGEAE